MASTGARQVTNVLFIVREKSKQIVELLSNDEHLEEEREKAKKIRDRMAGVTGGMNYGGYSGSGSGGNYGDKY